MATALQSFRFTAGLSRCVPIAQRYAKKPIGRRRDFSSTALLNDEKSADAEIEAILSKSDRLRNQWRLINQKFSSEEQFVEEAMADFEENIKTVVARAPKQPAPMKQKMKDTFLNMGEEEPIEEEDDEEDDHDDLTSLAHGELEKHRELRHYARLAAWEMPLLSKLAKPFVLPTRDEPLIFRYTTYLGEQHPAEKKVVVEFCPEDMPDLTPVQVEKLKKLAGVRYNPETEIAKMSCEMFETQAQNKRYLGDLVDTLLNEARNPTDTFEDVPLDIRHHRFKAKPKFPKEWLMTDKRRALLSQYREQLEMQEQQRMIEGRVVDGIQQIEEHQERVRLARSEMPEMAMAGNVAGPARGKKQKKVTTVRR